MTVKQAVARFHKEYPDRVVLGYWEDPDGYILQIYIEPGLMEPGQYMVPNNGDIYATNPLNAGIDCSKMKKF